MSKDNIVTRIEELNIKFGSTLDKAIKGLKEKNKQIEQLKAENNKTCTYVKVSPDGIGSWFESSCGICGNNIDESFKYCPFCGGKILRDNS